MKRYFSKQIFPVLVTIFSILLFTLPAHASILTPNATTTTCGELVAPGKSYIGDNITGVTSTCFVISSDGVEIVGNGKTISATGNVPLAIDARSYSSYPSTLLNGGNGYGDIVISNLTFTNFTNLIDASGNTDTTGSGINLGHGGQGGDVYIYYTNIASTTITTLGGNTPTYEYGGKGGNVYITDTDINLSSTTILTTSGMGTSNTTPSTNSGGLALTYTGTLSHTNLTLSPLYYLNENGSTTASLYPGGTWPILPGNISSCGTLMGPGTFTLTADIGSTLNPITGTCFNVATNNVT